MGAKGKRWRMYIQLVRGIQSRAIISGSPALSACCQQAGHAKVRNTGGDSAAAVAGTKVASVAFLVVSTTQARRPISVWSPIQSSRSRRLTLALPSVAVRRVVADLDITLSGAGKLLARAANLGLLVEIGARRSWRTYVTADVAVTLGVKPPDRGRPRTLSPTPRSTADILERFDAEMAAIDVRLQQLGVGS